MLSDPGTVQSTPLVDSGPTATIGAPDLPPAGRYLAREANKEVWHENDILWHRLACLSDRPAISLHDRLTVSLTSWRAACLLAIGSHCLQDKHG